MKKTTFLKSLLLAAALTTGASAWADNVYTILYGVPTYDTDNTTIIGVTPQTDFTSADGNTASDVTSSDANGTNCTNAMPIGGSVLHSSVSFTKKFESPATKGTVHFEANYTTTTNGQETWKIVDKNGVEIFGTTDAGYSNGNDTKIWGFCDGESLGTNWFRQPRSAHNRVVLDINLTSKVVSYTVLVSSGNNSYTTLTGTYNLPASVSDVSGLTATKQTYYSYMDNVSFYNVYDDAVTEYAYTLNYQFNNVTVASTTGAGQEGVVVSAENYVWNAGNTQKYFVKDNETTSFTISSGTNTFNVAVREAEVWNYTVKAIKGTDILGDIATNSVVEGETANYGYPQYFAADGKLYISTKQGSNPWWGKSFTPSANNATQEISYDAEGTEGVVFCKEAEDISTLTEVTGGNTDIRASNRAGGYAASEAVIATLPAGRYKMFGAVYGNSGTTFNFMAGNQTVLTIATDGNPTNTEGQEFTLSEETSITVTGGNGGNSPKIIDYVYIVKTGDIPTSVSATMGTNGFTTFSSAYNLDLANLPDGLKAYTATLSGTTLSFVECTEAVPAATGLLLAGDASTPYDIPVTTETATAVEGNALIAAVSATPLQSNENGTYYFAMLANSNPLAFAPISTTTSVTIPAGKAYVALAAGNARKLTVSFGNESTGINTIGNTENTVENYYNLNGQRVSAPQKGFYITNGKKIIIK